MPFSSLSHCSQSTGGDSTTEQRAPSVSVQRGPFVFGGPCWGLQVAVLYGGDPGSVWRGGRGGFHES
ncbi:unnamed protein product [Gadus morhua 'NCC']